MYSSETLPTAPRARGSNARETAQIVVELLRAGLEALDTNREAATRHLSKARLILETAGPSIFDGASVGLVPGGLAPWQVRRVKAYIEMNIDKPVTAKQLSAVVRLGPRHFQRAFKKCFGVGRVYYQFSSAGGVGTNETMAENRISHFTGALACRAIHRTS